LAGRGLFDVDYRDKTQDMRIGRASILFLDNRHKTQDIRIGRASIV
jgi:hypothetical protein